MYSFPEHRATPLRYDGKRAQTRSADLVPGPTVIVLSPCSLMLLIAPLYSLATLPYSPSATFYFPTVRSSYYVLAS